MDIEIRGVKFSYGSKSVLKSLSFKMESGNIVGILGQNGCGKTTLLNCINTILKPTGGCVMIDDPGGLGELDVQRMSSKDLAQHMATVAQTNSTSFPFTVMEAVKMGRYAQTRARDASNQDMDVIYNALERVGMLDFIDSHEPTTKAMYLAAKDIAEHSKEQTITNVMFILEREAVITTFEINDDDNF